MSSNATAIHSEPFISSEQVPRIAQGDKIYTVLMNYNLNKQKLKPKNYYTFGKRINLQKITSYFFSTYILKKKILSFCVENCEI